jgi:adenylosuccinate synthase
MGLLRIRSNRVSNLYPGAKRTITLTVHNNSNHAVRVRALRVRDLGTTKRGCAPTRRNLAIRRQSSRAFRLRSGGSRRVVFLLTMPNTVANACQGAVFDLRYKALLETSAR